MKTWIKMAKLIVDREDNKGIWTKDPEPIARILLEERGLSSVPKERIIRVAESITKDEAIEYVVQHEKI